MAYRIVAKSPKHLNDIVEDIMSWFETAREYRTQFDTESIKFADPVTKQVSGFRDIDVLHVQDITTGKKTVIKLIPLIRPEEMKIVMGGENEHVMKGKIKNMMKGRGEFKTYNKDTLRKMESQMKISEFKKMIREEIQNVLKEASKKFTPKTRAEVTQILADFDKKLKSGTPLDDADYAKIDKYQDGFWTDPEPMIKVYFSFTDTKHDDISMQKRAVTRLRNLFNPAASGPAKSLSSKDKEYLTDTLVSIAAGLADGTDMTDDIVDELGDSYEAVYATKDAKLIKAYDDLRGTADMPISAQKKATAALLKMFKSAKKLSAKEKDYLNDTVASIAAGLAAGDDMTDDIIDELGDSYDAVYGTGDVDLIAAYNNLRNAADMGVSAQKKATAAMLKILK